MSIAATAPKARLTMEAVEVEAALAPVEPLAPGAPVEEEAPAALVAEAPTISAEPVKT